MSVIPLYDNDKLKHLNWGDGDSCLIAADVCLSMEPPKHTSPSPTNVATHLLEERPPSLAHKMQKSLTAYLFLLMAEYCSNEHNSVGDSGGAENESALEMTYEQEEWLVDELRKETIENKKKESLALLFSTYHGMSREEKKAYINQVKLEFGIPRNVFLDQIPAQGDRVKYSRNEVCAVLSQVVLYQTLRWCQPEHSFETAMKVRRSNSDVLSLDEFIHIQKGLGPFEDFLGGQKMPLNPRDLAIDYGKDLEGFCRREKIAKKKQKISNFIQQLNSIKNKLHEHIYV